MAENEITAEIRKKVQAAVKAVAKEKFKESSHIDRADLQTFLDAISVKGIESLAPLSVLPGQQLVETNLAGQEYLFPGNPARQGKRESNANARGHLDLNQPPLIGGVEGSVNFTANEQLKEPPRPIPPLATRTHEQNTSTHIYKLYLTVQADCLVRVYGSKPLVVGASAGGGLGAVAGTASGIAGGITVGALAGSVVPVAGTIVGGIVGGVVGAVGGLIVGGTAGIGSGASFGAIHSNRTYKMIQAREVFKKLQNFSDGGDNACQCTIVANTVRSLDYRTLRPATSDD